MEFCKRLVYYGVRKALMFGSHIVRTVARTVQAALSRVFAYIARCARQSWGSLLEVWTEPSFPLIILGVVAAAFFFAFVLKATPEVVVGVLVIGGVTAFLETKLRK